MSVNEFNLQSTEDREPADVPGERREEELREVLELEASELRAVAGGPSIKNNSD